MTDRGSRRDSLSPGAPAPGSEAEAGIASFVPPRARAALAATGRQVAGVVVSGVLAAALWLVIVQRGRESDLTDLDFARGLALSVGADGINRQEVGSRGLEATLALGVILMALFALVGAGLPKALRGGWWPRTVPLGVVVFLAWGLGFSPARPSGILGLQAGGVSSMLVFLVASAGFAVVGVRVYTLIAEADWWRPKENLLEQELEALTAQQKSLELPEEGREEGGVRPRG